MKTKRDKIKYKVNNHQLQQNIILDYYEVVIQCIFRWYGIRIYLPSVNVYTSQNSSVVRVSGQDLEGHWFNPGSDHVLLQY